MLFATREQTRADVLHAGRDLAHALAAMKGRVETLQKERQLFQIDDQIRPPLHLSKRLSVRASYSWRPFSVSNWVTGQITLICGGVILAAVWISRLGIRKPLVVC
jgi:hypothetical protein